MKRRHKYARRGVNKPLHRPHPLPLVAHVGTRCLWSHTYRHCFRSVCLRPVHTSRKMKDETVNECMEALELSRGERGALESAIAVPRTPVRDLLVVARRTAGEALSG